MNQDNVSVDFKLRFPILVSIPGLFESVLKHYVTEGLEKREIPKLIGRYLWRIKMKFRILIVKQMVQ